MGIHNDLAKIFAELSQNLAGAPSNVLLVGLLRQAAPRQIKTNVWARLRGQKEQLTIKVLHHLYTATPVTTLGMQISSDNGCWACHVTDRHRLYYVYEASATCLCDARKSLTCYEGGW